VKLSKIRLGEIAYARSGDKGSSANIGIIAKTEECYAMMLEHLTAAHVAEFLGPMGARGVTRFELLNLAALNFVLEGVLAGGGSRSLRIDAQGKALGQALLEIELEVPEEFARRYAAASNRAGGNNAGS
jgi:hypothetical protein